MRYKLMLLAAKVMRNKQTGGNERASGRRAFLGSNHECVG